MIAVCYVVHDDAYYLAESIASFKSAGDVFVFVSRLPWSGEPGDWEATAQIARDAGAEVILGDWAPEDTHRQAAIEELRQRGYHHLITPDGDEFIEPALLRHLVRIAEAELADRVYIHWCTYWKSPEYVIRPMEPFTPLIMLDIRDAFHHHIRDYGGGRPLLLGPEFGIMHHLSYVGPDERILRKISTWGHKDEIVQGWLENVWYRWDGDRLLRNLHPVSPPNYHMAERIHVPPELEPALSRYRQLMDLPESEPQSSGTGEGGPAEDLVRGEQAGEDASPDSPPLFLGEGRTGSLREDDVRGGGGGRGGLSLIIPLYGGVEDVIGCLESLRACRDLWHEVVIVDNASPDGADLAAEEYDFVKLIRNETNLGFAKACNQGAEAATGDVLLFLNSDTVVTRAGLTRLVESLQSSGSIAAAGPYTNRAGHLQQIDPTYTGLETLDLFAEDFACRDVPDVDVDMLVGFCLAVKRPVWDEVGGFDERFGMGMYEDNDLSYRCRRAGYRLVIAARSFIHHAGSQTLMRSKADVAALLRNNRKLYLEKWRDDLETGFASSLSGLALERIVFNAERHPDARAGRVADLARRADISLCMIVRNEERVLADCLKSAKPFFREMIVVDTGSTDCKKEIAAQMGGEPCGGARRQGERRDGAPGARAGGARCARSAPRPRAAASGRRPGGRGLPAPPHSGRAGRWGGVLLPRRRLRSGRPSGSGPHLDGARPSSRSRPPRYAAADRIAQEGAWRGCRDGCRGLNPRMEPGDVELMAGGVPEGRERCPDPCGRRRFEGSVTAYRRTSCRRPRLCTRRRRSEGSLTAYRSRLPCSAPSSPRRAADRTADAAPPDTSRLRS
jgi:GT2 family glycosyltransferase